MRDASFELHDVMFGGGRGRPCGWGGELKAVRNPASKLKMLSVATFTKVFSLHPTRAFSEPIGRYTMALSLLTSNLQL